MYGVGGRGILVIGPKLFWVIGDLNSYCWWFGDEAFLVIGDWRKIIIGDLKALFLVIANIRGGKIQYGQKIIVHPHQASCGYTATYIVTTHSNLAGKSLELLWY